MTVEPLWTGPPGHDGSRSYLNVTFDHPSGTDVAVVRADSLPTRERVEHAIRDWLVSTPYVRFWPEDEDRAVESATDAIMDRLSAPSEPPMAPLRGPEGDPALAAWWKVSRQIGGWDVVGLDQRDEITYECCHLHASRADGVACGRRTMPGVKGPTW